MKFPKLLGKFQLLGRKVRVQTNPNGRFLGVEACSNRQRVWFLGPVSVLVQG